MLLGCVSKTINKIKKEFNTNDEMNLSRLKYEFEEFMETPRKNLTNKQKFILKEFEKEGGTSKAHSPKSQSFFKKIKEVWQDLR